MDQLRPQRLSQPPDASRWYCLLLSWQDAALLQGHSWVLTHLVSPFFCLIGWRALSKINSVIYLSECTSLSVLQEIAPSILSTSPKLFILLFYSPPLHVVGGIPTLWLWGWPNTRHRHCTDKPDNRLLVTPTHNPEGKGTTRDSWSYGVALSTEWTTRGCGRQALWYQEGRWTQASVRGCGWFVSVFLRAGRELKPALQGQGRLCLVPVMRRAVQLGEFIQKTKVNTMAFFS